MSQARQPLLSPAELRRWTKVSPTINLLCVAGDYAWLIALHAINIYLTVHVDSWAVLVPAGLVTIFLTGCLMHRIALLGHEASHGLLHPNRKWNDVLADLLCFFPFWSSANSYRAKHQGHHLHPNDPDRDPNLAGYKAEELYGRFPMPRPSFIWNYYAKFLWPPFVLKNLLDLFRMLACGRVPGMGKPAPVQPEEMPVWWQRLGKALLSPLALGIAHLVLLAMVTRHLVAGGNGLALLAGHLGCLAASTLLWKMMSKEKFVRSRRESAETQKNRALFRLMFYSSILIVTGWVRLATGFNLGVYYLIFWIVPLLYVFPYLMLLREIYQHANLGTGKLDNSRIIHADPFTRWTLLPYGNDFHLVHHIYPNIPHYHLRETHECLLARSSSYRESIVETAGVFHAPEGQTPLLDSFEGELQRS